MIPIRTDRRLNRTPVVNYLLILVNFAVFVFVQKFGHNEAISTVYSLSPDQPQVYQFFTCIFLHAGWEHIIGNMLFLWVFGNAVNDALGHVGYLAFYLAGGVIAGVGYVLLSGQASVLGASGAISAVTGAFLVLFPRVRVTVLMFLFYIFPLEISSLFFLLMQFAWNLWATMSAAGGGVAYVAHLSGYAFGIVVAAGLLALRILPRDVYDLLSLIKTWKRRWEYRRTVASGYDPYGFHRLRRTGQTQADQQWPPQGPVAPPAGPAGGPGEAVAAGSPEEQLRQQIARDHAGGNFPAAADGYLKLVQIADQAVLPQPQQLDVANYLMSVEQYPAAADAYERFLARYPNYEYRADIELMLGLIYSRYLQQDALAERYLSKALPELTDTRKAELAREELAKVRARAGRK